MSKYKHGILIQLKLYYNENVVLIEKHACVVGKEDGGKRVKTNI
jgi:hypothetical protein